MARLYSDEHFPFPVVEELRRLGHDVVTIQERGQANLRVPDDAVLAFAHGEGRALLTQNRWISSDYTIKERIILESLHALSILTT
jgi:hypothetical protein